jgi:hypothetical protein
MVEEGLGLPGQAQPRMSDLCRQRSGPERVLYTWFFQTGQSAG